MDWSHSRRRGLEYLFLAVLVAAGYHETEGSFMGGVEMTGTTMPTTTTNFPTPSSCPPGYMFCFDDDQCIHIQSGTCLPACGPDEWHEPTSDGHYTCASSSSSGDYGSGGWFGDYGSGEWPRDDADKCEGETCFQCPIGQVFCMETDTCIGPDGSCGSNCPMGMEMCHDGYSSYCMPIGSQCGQDSGDDCSDGLCSTCYDGQVFCMESDTCINPDGSCGGTCPTGMEPCGPPGMESCVEVGTPCYYNQCPLGQEMCHDGYSSYCMPIGSQCGQDNGDDCDDGLCQTCYDGQVFCFESGQCSDSDGMCGCTEEQEACWSSGEQTCVAKGECPMSRVRIKLPPAFAEVVGSMRNQFEAHFKELFAERFGVPDAIPRAQLDDEIGFLDLWTSLPLGELRHGLQGMIDEVGLTDLDNNPIPVTTFVVDECRGHECMTGETETDCHANIEEWCPALRLCLSKNTTCPASMLTDVFYIRIPLNASGIFVTCSGSHEWHTRAVLHKLTSLIQEYLGRFFTGMLTMEHVSIQPQNSVDDRLVVMVEAWGDMVSDEALRTRLEDLKDEEEEDWMTEHGDITFVKAPEDAELVYLYPLPLPAGVEMKINLTLILPADRIQTPAILDCAPSSQNILLEGAGGVFGTEAGLVSALRVIIAKYTGTTVTHVKCALKVDSRIQGYIRFLAVPESLDSMAKVRSVSLREGANTMVIDEHTDWHSLPEQPFIFTDRSGALFESLNSWPEAMVGVNEIWVGAGRILPKLLVDVRNTKLASIAATDALVNLESSIVGEVPSVTIHYKNLLLEKNYKTKVLSCQGLIKFGVRNNYRNNFQLKIQPVFYGALPLTIQVQVLHENDPPRIRRQRGGVNSPDTPLTFPRVPVLNDPPYSEPEFNVCDLAGQLFYDLDLGTEEKLGLAVIGYIDSTVKGTWSWSSDGVTWSSIQKYTDGVTWSSIQSYQAILLDCDVKMKFTPSPEYEGVAWLEGDAPQIVAAGWDKTNLAELGDQRVIDVQFGECPFTTYRQCLSGGGTSLSLLTVTVPLLRRGCDQKLSSGLEMMACGCGIPDEACTDCNGVVNGTAYLDGCGECVGGTTGVVPEVCEGGECPPDCARCYDKNVEFCDRKASLEQKSDNKCPGEDMISNPDFDRESCTLKCIPKEQLDDACFTCGENTCRDCDNVLNGNKVWNLCNQCVAPDLTSENCNIGQFKPSFVYNAATVNITASYSGDLLPDATVTLDLPVCQLSPVRSDNPNVVVPTVEGQPIIYYEQQIIKLITHVPSLDLPNAIGQYAVTCSLLGEELPGSSEPFTRFGHPEITAISPPEQLYNSLGEVVIEGPGFVDTGVVRCVVDCGEDARQSVCQHGVPGQWLDEQHVSCDMNYLRGFRTARAYSVNVVLGKLPTVDLDNLPSPLTFTVRAPAPKVKMAALHPYGCKELKIYFNMMISGVEETSCSSYFTNPELSDAECDVSGHTLFVVYQSEMAVGGELIFKNGVIKHAMSESEVAETFSGTVVVTAEIPESVPQVDLYNPPTTVGCSPVLLRPYKKFTGCFDVHMVWQVELVTEDPVDPSLQTHLDTLNAALEDKELFQLKADQLLDGYTYNFTLRWEVVGNDQYSGSASAILAKDKSAMASAEIVGLNDEVDPAKQIKMEANLHGCMSSLTNKQVKWFVTGPTIFHAAKSMTFIPANTLSYGSTYTVLLTVMLDSVTITKEKVFVTKEMDMEAAVRYNEDDSSDDIDVKATEDVVLTCVNKAAAAESSGDYTCIWMCEDNFWGESEDEFSACLNDDGNMLWQMGEMVTLSASGRKDPGDWDLRQRWHLVMKSKKSQRASNTTRTMTYKAFDDTISAADIVIPEIKLRSSDFIYVSEEDRYITVVAYCKSATKYTWESIAEDESGDATVEPLPHLNLAASWSSLEKQLIRDTCKFVYCGIKLRLASLPLVYGVVYGFRLNVKNELSRRFHLSTSQTIRIQKISSPNPGTIEIFSADDIFTAMSSEFDVILTNWFDEIDKEELDCDINFYDDTMTRRTNAVPVRPYRSVTGLQLPEGVYNFATECCNRFRRCAESHTETPITVLAVPPNDLLIRVTTFTIQLSMDPVSLLNAIQDIYQAVMNAVSPPSEKEDMKNQLKSAANSEIQGLVDTSRDNDNIEDKFSVLRSTQHVVMEIEGPDNLEEDTVFTLKIAVIEVMELATGHSFSGTRRKRSTSQYTTPCGLTQEQADTVQNIYVITIADPASLTQEEAEEFSEVIDAMMVGMCIMQAEQAAVMVSDSTYTDVRVHKTALNGTATTEFHVACDECSTYPAKVIYGHDIEAAYDHSWNSSEWTLDDICVASAQLSIDVFTPTSNADAPARVSDFVVLKMINPITYETESHSSLSDPVQVTLALYENSTMVNVTIFDYKCKMWMESEWVDGECTTTEPQMEGDVYRVVCSCTALGVIGVFKQLKPLEEETNSTSTTSSVGTSNSETTTTTTPAPSKSLLPSTDFLLMTFSFSNDFDNDVTDKTATKIHLKNQMVANTGYTAANFKEFEIVKGSIIVSFELHSSGQVPLGQMAYVVESLINSGTTVFTTSTGTPLTIIPGSFSYTEKDADDDDDKDDTKDLLPYIIGGALGGLAIIGVVIILVVLILKTNSRAKTVPAAQPQPPAHQHAGPQPEYIPPYALAPPPPYMYEAPQMNVAFPRTAAQWEENEVKPVKAGDVKKMPDDLRKMPDVERPEGSRSHSRQSMETGLQKKENGSAPTPVDP